MKYPILSIFVLFGLQLVTCDSEEEIKKKCLSLAMEAAEIEKTINATYRFLRTPAEYKAVADKCQETIECAEKVEPTKDGQEAGKFGMCPFYVFYNRQFASCATKLIAKKDDKINCLDILFNDYDEPNVDECDQWDSLQACIKTQIESVCGQKPDDWAKEAAIFRKAMCDTS